MCVKGQDRQNVLLATAKKVDVVESGRKRKQSGRKTKRRYRTPVVAFPTVKGFVVPMSYGRDVDWARNIKAAGKCEVERLGGRVKVQNPRVVGSKTAYRHLPVLVRPALLAANLPGYLLLER